MRKIKQYLTVLIAVILSAFIVLATPQLPESYNGQVYLDDVLVQDGTDVCACVCQTTECYCTKTATYPGFESFYGLDVPVDDPDTTTIKEGATNGASLCWTVAGYNAHTPASDTVETGKPNNNFNIKANKACTSNDDCNSLDGECADGFCNLQTGQCQQQFKLDTTVCRASQGVCDLEEKCTGQSKDCPADAKSTAECRAATGVCDIAEVCDGINNGCPGDSVRANTYECRAAANDCDIAEKCDGTTKNCPADAKASADTECGQARNCPDDACNGFIAEFYPIDGHDKCDGQGNCLVYSCALETKYCTDNNEADGVNTLECGAACDQDTDCKCADDACIDADQDASADDYADYPQNGACLNDCSCSVGTGEGGYCEPAITLNDPKCLEICNNGIDDDGDELIDCEDTSCVGQVCRAAAGVCDIAEKCDGQSKDCPADAKSTVECRASIGICDIAEVCDGINNGCPGDSVRANTYECRAAANDCDIAEKCDGTTKNCPADAKASADTECGQARNCPDDACNGFIAEFYPIDGHDKCDGDGNCIVYSCALETKYCTDNNEADGVNTLECNAPCDQNNDCDDSDPSTIDTCTNNCECIHTREICNNQIDDDNDGKIDCEDTDCAEKEGPLGVICCQNDDNCNNLDADCADGVCSDNVCQQQFKLATTVCRASAGVCDIAEKCTGQSKDCPADGKSTAQCRASAGICDIAENCDGVNNDCPTNVFKPLSTDCGICAHCDGLGTCTYDETQDNDCNACPQDVCTDKNNDGIIDAYNDYNEAQCEAIYTCKACGPTIIEPDKRCKTTMKIPVDQYVSMFSLPLVPETPVTFNNIQNGCTFTGGITDGIAYWDPLKAGSNKYVYINANTILHPGQGYFTTQENECEFTINGYKFTTDYIGYLGTSDIKSGWNMIGAPSDPINNFDLIEGTCNVVSGPWGFDAANYRYVRTQRLEPGKGYYIKTTNNCNLS